MTKKITDLEINPEDEASLYEKRESVAYLDKAMADRLAAFLKYSEVSDVLVEYDEISAAYNVTVSSKDFEKANNLYEVFAENELDNDKDAADDSSVEINLYENSTDKYKDNLSSAITFFICGGAGIIVLLLNAFGVINLLSRESSSFILMNIVLGALFVGFIVIGFSSLKYSKKIKETASKEEKALENVMNWLTENVSKETIEASYDSSIPEEMKYFNRSEYIKNALKEEFTDMDDTIIDFINDKYIEKLF